MGCSGGAALSQAAASSIDLHVLDWICSRATLCIVLDDAHEHVQLVTVLVYVGVRFLVPCPLACVHNTRRQVATLCAACRFLLYYAGSASPVFLQVLFWSLFAHSNPVTCCPACCFGNAVTLHRLCVLWDCNTSALCVPVPVGNHGVAVSVTTDGGGPAKDVAQ
jgi:hypothetical protein